MRLRSVLTATLALAFLVGCQLLQAPSRSHPADTGSTGSSAPPAGTSPAATVSSTPTAAATSATPTSIAGVRTNALGALSGNWIFAAKQVIDPAKPQLDIQVWAVPVGGGAAKLALSYDAPAGGAPESFFDNRPYLRRLFSPDGRRMVISASGELAIVDLESGRARAVGVSGSHPSWSRDGSGLAFLVPVPVADQATPDVWVAIAPADGGPIRRVARLDAAHQAVEWSPDGSSIVIPRRDGVSIVEVASGRVIRTVDGVPGPPPSFAHWRNASPQLALSFFGCTRSSLVALDGPTAPERSVVSGRDGERCLVVHDPRWNPAANEILFVGAPMNEICCRAHVVEVGSGRDTTLPFETSQATWSSDGAQVIYVAREPTYARGVAVRIWPRDGRPERELLAADSLESIVSLTSVSY